MVRELVLDLVVVLLGRDELREGAALLLEGDLDGEALLVGELLLEGVALLEGLLVLDFVAAGRVVVLFTPDGEAELRVLVCGREYAGRVVVLFVRVVAVVPDLVAGRLYAGRVVVLFVRVGAVVVLVFVYPGLVVDLLVRVTSELLRGLVVVRVVLERVFVGALVLVVGRVAVPALRVVLVRPYALLFVLEVLVRVVVEGRSTREFLALVLLPAVRLAELAGRVPFTLELVVGRVPALVATRDPLVLFVLTRDVLGISVARFTRPSAAAWLYFSEKERARFEPVLAVL